MTFLQILILSVWTGILLAAALITLYARCGMAFVSYLSWRYLTVGAVWISESNVLQIILAPFWVMEFQFLKREKGSNEDNERTLDSRD